MKFAFNFPIFDHFSDARVLANMAVEAEQAGWDAVLLWDHVNLVQPFMANGGPHADPWMVLALMADRTQSITLGTCVTPIARRRPVKLAREIMTIHEVSDGRFTFGAGAGDSPSEFDKFGEAATLRERAAMLDEGLDLLQALLSGKPVNHQGHYYQVETDAFSPVAIDVPIFLSGTWPNKKPFDRAARFDGIYAMKVGWIEPLTPEEITAIRLHIMGQRKTDRPFSLSVGAHTTDDQARDREWAAAISEAGADWWQDGTGTQIESLEQATARLRRGPPV